MAINAGELTKKITIQYNSDIENKNSFGELIPEWSTLATVWAKVEQTPSRSENSEKHTEGITKQIATYEFTVRYRTDIDRHMRINYKNRYFEIKNIENVEQDNHTLILLAEEVS